MNEMLITGNIGNAELRNAPDGTPIFVFSLADNYTNRHTGERKTTWYRVAKWGEGAKGLVQYIAKGQAGVTIKATLVNVYPYVNKETGEPGAIINVKLDRVVNWGYTPAQKEESVNIF